MGMKKLATIAAIYIAEGSGDMPAVIIQHATLPQKKIAKGCIRNLPFLAEQNHISHPAIIIIGHVADINGMMIAPDL